MILTLDLKQYFVMLLTKNFCQYIMEEKHGWALYELEGFEDRVAFAKGPSNALLQ